MKSPLFRMAFLAVFVFALTALPAYAQLGAGLGDQVANWTPASYPRGIHTMTDVTPPRAFIGVAPCRIVDTRGPAGPYGAPALAAGVSRNFALPGGPCAGIPAGVDAYSLNITATNTLGPGFILMYPQGGVAPLVSTLNYLAGQTVANAAIIPAGTGGGITIIAGVSGTDLIIDINGYFSSTPNTAGNFFSITNNSGGYSITTSNTSTTCGGTCGILAQTSSGNAIEGDANGTTGYGVYGYTQATGNFWAGVLGQSTAASGQQFGVQGILNSTNTTGCAGGVFGRAGTQIPCNFTGSAGVYGTNNTGFGGDWGVLGNSLDRGVQGSRVNASGVGQTFGVLGYAGTSGVFSFNDITKLGTVAFVQPHPSSADKQITYVAIESREVTNFFRGRAKIERGFATIGIPEDFSLVTEPGSLSVQATPIGEMAQVAVDSISADRIVLRGSRNVEVFYTVYGVRKGYADFEATSENVYFVPNGAADKMPELPEATRQLLVANKVLNADGTVNLDTAERLGWTKAWAQREAEARVRALAVQTEGSPGGKK